MTITKEKTVMVKIIAHRGSSGEAPENTMYAFRKAVEDGADAIETDVRKTKDGVLIIMHDATLKRIAGDDFADFDVTKMTYDEIKDVDISSKNYPNLPVQRIAKLAELLELVKETGIEVNIELKGNQLVDDGLEYDVVELVRQYGVENKIFYSCFDHPMLVNVLKANPSAKVAPLYGNSMYKVEEYAKAMGAFAIHPEFKGLLVRGDIKAVRGAGLEINTWTVNHAEDAKTLVKAGVTGLITNFPKQIRAAVEQM